MMIIVESGATKTAWRAVDPDGTVREALTGGLNPTGLASDHIRDNVRKAIPVLNPSGARVGHIHFYGAGIVSEDSAAPIRSCLEEWCPFAEVEFHSDLLAAARALFADGSGVVAIMGTGSNSCLYEKGKIIRNIRPGGYILGDEGSGAALGRAFLADFIKDIVPGHIASEFAVATGLDYPAIVRRVYKEKAASAFMASLAPFILSRSSDPYMRSLVEDSIDSFARRALARYASEEMSGGFARRVGVVGSFGCACEDFLREAGERYGLEFVRFLKSPIDELVRYHREYGI